MRLITVRLQKGKGTNGTYGFNSGDPSVAITSLYARVSACEGGSAPKRIVLTVQEARHWFGRAG